MNDYFELFLFGIAMIFVTMPVFAALDKADDVHEGVMMGTLILAMMGTGAMGIGTVNTLTTLFGQIA